MRFRLGALPLRAFARSAGRAAADASPDRGVFPDPGGYPGRGAFPDPGAFPGRGGHPDPGAFPGRGAATDADARPPEFVPLRTEPVGMWQDPLRRWPDPGEATAEDERLRPMYARALGLRHVEPGGLLCFLFFEGTMVLGFLLALAELVSWWGVLMLPASVALMVKINDVVAAAVARSAARVPEREQARFRRELQPAVGRAAVPASALAVEARELRRFSRREEPGGPAGAAGAAGTPTMARVRPELVAARVRPRPLAIADTGHEREETGPGPGEDRRDPTDPPPVRRPRNTPPIAYDRHSPDFPSDRWGPAGGTEHWVRQSAQVRYRDPE